uniref:Chromophore lyase n=1 Tax=Schizymenia dubyi TaxID=38368 RepID=A0A1C9C974_9FLOR|nr:chromophore lyase [Schizymenia dubyi]AOM64937.1 chromophore lyase [Schizymenia dubyi]
MTTSLETFLQKIEGEWLSQETIYYLQTKYEQNNLSTVNIKYLASNKKQDKKSEAYKITYNINNFLSEYYFSHLYDNNFGIIEKYTNKHNKTYEFKIHSHNCIEIKTYKANIEYIEYLYLIDHNLKLSLSLLKKFDKYISISFNSKIKIAKTKDN